MDLLNFKDEFARLIRDLNDKGHSPATSTNYSFREIHGQIWITRSGFDKSSAQASDFIEVDKNANAIRENTIPSAETKIHCELYNLFNDCKVILHSHSLYPVIISELYEKHFKMNGYEIQKGFRGVNTHESNICIPILDNSQNMDEIVENMNNRKNELKTYSIILKKHGAYVWGTNLFEAKRHLETLNYLCEIEYKRALIYGYR